MRFDEIYYLKNLFKERLLKSSYPNELFNKLLFITKSKLFRIIRINIFNVNNNAIVKR